MRTALILFALLLSGPLAAAELVLIANPKSGITQLGKDDVVNIYLGRYRRLPSGLTAEPVDQPADSELRARFYRQLVGKNMTEINAYWARLRFSGDVLPPHALPNYRAVVDAVRRNPKGIGYVDAGTATDAVRVVLRLKED